MPESANARFSVPRLGRMLRPPRRGSVVSEEEESRVKKYNPSNLPLEVVSAIEALVLYEEEPLTLPVCLAGDEEENVLRTQDEPQNDEQNERNESINVVVEYLCSRPTKMDAPTRSCLELLLLSTPSSGSDLQEAWRFLTDPRYTTRTAHSPPLWEPPLRDLCVWWEIRARLLRARQQQEEESHWVVRGGDAAAQSISAAAHWMEQSLKRSVPWVHGGLDRAGDAVKRSIGKEDSQKKTVFKSPKEEVVTLAYADAAARVTSGLHHSVKTTVHVLRDTSSDGLEWAAEKFQQQQLGERMVPDSNQRHALAAAGKVGLASLGAAAIVAEAAWDVTRQVAHHSSYVAADVVRYKYGDSAGKLVQDTADATGHVVRTVAHVAMLETSVLAKIVAKQNAKAQVRRRVAGSDDEDNYGDDDTGTEELLEDEEDHDDVQFIGSKP